MKVLVTGNAGFIGFHVARALMARGDAVVGIDVVNDYYDPGLKEARLAALGRAAAETGAAYEFRRADLADRAAVEAAFADHRFDRVINLAAQNPVIEVPVRGEYAPNTFVSVFVVRGRIGDVQPTAMVDLGKPAFKLGITELRVGWRAHRLIVDVQPDRPTYRVRETAIVRLAVRSDDGTPLTAGSEVAVAAVDEGLLELMPNKSWNLLDAMMGRRGYGVRTATAQLEVIGKRHFGRKALPPGGGGGRQSTRELFDTLLLWQGRVASPSLRVGRMTVAGE